MDPFDFRKFLAGMGGEITKGSTIEGSSTSNGQILCDVCAKLVSLFLNGSDHHWLVQIANPKEMTDFKGCDVHNLLFRSLFGYQLDIPLHHRSIAMAGETDTWSLALKFESEHGGLILPEYSEDLMLHPTTSRPHMKSEAKVVDQFWIDTSVFQDWKQLCNAHNHSFQSILQSPKRPAWLVDTRRLCLVPGYVGTSYVALSYVWGKTEFFKTTRQNIEGLRKEFALMDIRREPRFSRTISDAIAVVGLLNEQYLWVDALCIVQDDDITRPEELSKMASIFDGATVTIVAAQGEDADYGLRGLRDISLPRKYPQEVLELAKDCKIVRTRCRPKEPTSWFKRGWTYQESLFSSRILMFAGNSVQWTCEYGTFWEDVEFARPIYKDATPSISRLSTFSTSVPSFMGYGELINEYNGRDFTNPGDALDAFIGTTTALSRNFFGGFICGLPLMFLDVALCWQPSENCERRITSSNSVPTRADIPSWSWAGWKCKIDLNAWVNGIDYVKRTELASVSPNSQQTTPIMDWFSCNGDMTQTRPLQSMATMHELKAAHLAEKENLDLPAGWERFDFIDYPKNETESNYYDAYTWKALGQPRYFYKHESDPDSEFWYPIPLVDVMREEYSPTQDHTLLCGHTHRAWFRLSQEAIHYSSIRDDEGHWAGVLIPNVENYPSYENTNDSSYAQMTACELVAISAGYTGNLSGGMVEYQVKECQIGERYEYFNVLWVEWKDNIAYRKGCGRVKKSAWLAQHPEPFQLVLG